VTADLSNVTADLSVVILLSPSPDFWGVSPFGFEVRTFQIMPGLACPTCESSACDQIKLGL